jgi:2-iminobutanoate/2-iminopropanoate deaminase
MLEEPGSSLAKAVRMGVYIIDIDDFQAMNEVYIEFFPEQPPARTTLVVSRFPPSVNLTACGFFLTGLT